MVSDDKRLIISGGLTASFWAVVLGVRLGFPDMVVPFGWAAALIVVGIIGLIATLFFAIVAYSPRTRRRCFDMRFPELVRRVAVESQWAADFKADTPADQWQQTFWWEPLRREICRHLTADEPDLHARGILTTKERAETGPRDIPPAFWRRAEFPVNLMLGNDQLDAAYSGTEWYDDVRFSAAEVNAVWPRRSARAMNRSPSPFVAWHKDWAEEQKATRLNSELQIAQQVEQAKLAKTQSQPKGAAGQREQSIAAIRAIDDEINEQHERALETLGTLLPPDKMVSVRAGVSRDVDLAEGLGWIVYGEWGKPFHGVPFTAALSGIDIRELLAEMTARAAEGKITIWGKELGAGIYKKTAKIYWQSHELTLPDIFGGTDSTGPDAYRDLKLSRRELEGEWPHEK